jgi:creatinine amidohydrolase
MIGSLYDLTSPEVARALEASPTVVLPFGSVEQHGPHLPCGTDTMTAELIARELADRVGALYAPFCPYGITPLHSGHPGTISLRRQTFEALLGDVCRELIDMGARTLVLCNWHEGNTASLNAVATDLQAIGEARFYVAQACYVADRIYSEQAGPLSHGGGIETLAVMAVDPELVKLERAEAREQAESSLRVDEMRRSREVYGFVTDVAEISEQGWYGDPSWATRDRAAGFSKTVVDEIVARLEAIGALEGGRGR